MKQRILIIGSGGREHALAWKISQSPQLAKLFCAPGNAGTAELATNVRLRPDDNAGIVEFALAENIDLVVVAPDDALAAGLVDDLASAGVKAFGPTQAAARIESSKAYAKDLMVATGVPTAQYKAFTDRAAAEAYLATRAYPLVVKASGLALGKGVYICRDLASARAALDDMMTDAVFGQAGSTVVIEDFLGGQEVSLHAFCDGQSAQLFPPAQDHKPVGDGGTGPNTGGMGTYAPVPFVSVDQLAAYRAQVVEPILSGLASRGIPYKGVLYPGLMVNGDQVKVLEYNARFGDPETQSYMRLLETDLVDILNACIDGTLANLEISWSKQSVVTVVMASGGYPGSYAKGYPITGLPAAAQIPGVVVFQAGTKLVNGQLVTASGRVLGVSATAPTLAEAKERAYQAVARIHFSGAHYRTDIAAAALKDPQLLEGHQYEATTK